MSTNSNWTHSLWLKTFVGFFFGFLLSMSVFMVVGFLAPIPRDVFLLIAVMGGFTLWCVLMTWFYSVESIKKPALITLILFLITAFVNAFFYVQASQ